MELVLIRHGECIINPADPLYDPMDPPLTARGWRQARYAGKRIAESPPDILYCGPLLRNLQTAHCIHEATGLRPQLIWSMFEVAYNPYVRSRGSIEKEFSVVQFGHDDTHPRHPQESREHAHRRAHVLWHFWLDAHGKNNQRVGVVSHGVFNDLLLAAMLELPLIPQIRFLSGNCAFHVVHATPEEVHFLKLNDETHIPETERT